MLKSVGKGRQLYIGASCCTSCHSLQFHTHTHTHTRAHTCGGNGRRKSLCDPTTSISYTDQLSRSAGGLDTGQNHSMPSPVHHDPTLMNLLQFVAQWTPPIRNHLIRTTAVLPISTFSHRREKPDGLTAVTTAEDRRISAGQETAGIYYTERFTTVFTKGRSQPMNAVHTHTPTHP